MSNSDEEELKDVPPTEQPGPAEEEPQPSTSNGSTGARRRDPPPAGIGRGGYRTSRRGPHESYNNRKTLVIPTHKMACIVGKGGIKIREIEHEAYVKIEIGNASGITTNVTLYGTDLAIARAEMMIVMSLQEFKILNENVPRAQPPACDNQGPECFTTNATGRWVADWANIANFYNRRQENMQGEVNWVIKKFYREDIAITTMSLPEAFRWRLNNDYIQVFRPFGNTSIRPQNPVLTFEHAFQDFPQILQAIYNQGFREPSPIQSQVWPILLSGEDMIAIIHTGQGKILAFLLPALIHLDGQVTLRDKREGPTVLILVPTREVALLIQSEVLKYQHIGITSVCFYDTGAPQEPVPVMSKGVDIVITTPLRLNNLVTSGLLIVSNISFVVMDEIDTMLEMGFEEQLRNSLDNLRPNRQTVMTSAAMLPRVRLFAQAFLTDPVQVIVGSPDLAALHTVTQSIIFINADVDKMKSIMEIVLHFDRNNKVLIFCGNLVVASFLAAELALNGISGSILHGQADQNNEDTRGDFNTNIDAPINVLLATNLAPRPIGIDNIVLVINWDLPRDIDEYVYRVAQAGRGLRPGMSLTFITRQDWIQARELADTLQTVQQALPDELAELAYKFTTMRLRQCEDRGRGRGPGRGRGEPGEQRKGDLR